LEAIGVLVIKTGKHYRRTEKRNRRRGKRRWTKQRETAWSLIIR